MSVANLYNFCRWQILCGKLLTHFNPRMAFMNAIRSKVTDKERAVIREFVEWWMDFDLENSLSLFVEKFNKLYNEQITKAMIGNFKGLFSQMPDEFGKEDLLAKAIQNGIRSKVRYIASVWKQAGLIEKVHKNHWIKNKSVV